MANDFKNSISASVGTTPIEMYTAPSLAGTRSMIIGLDVCNIHATNDVTVDVEIWDNSNTTWAHYAKNLVIPNGGTASIIAGQKVVLEEEDKVRVTCNTSGGASAILSILEDV
jgi:hypothetical protein